MSRLRDAVAREEDLVGVARASGRPRRGRGGRRRRIAAPRRRARRRRRLLDALHRRLVLAQPEEARLAHRAVARPLGERALARRASASTQRASFVFGTRSARGSSTRSGSSRFAQSLARRVVEARADAPGVDELPVLDDGEDERAHRRPRCPTSGIQPMTAHSCRRSKRSLSQLRRAPADVRRALAAWP